MKIKILGTRGEIEAEAPFHSQHSGILVDNQILLDCGEKDFLKERFKWVILTHLHPDHAYFVRWGKEEVPPVNVPIYAPELPEKSFLKSSVTLLNKKIKLGPYEIIPIPTHHSKKVKSQAYLVKKNNKSFLYTGDMIWINKEYQFLYENVDVVITEASFIKKGGMIRKDKVSSELYGHQGIPNLIDFFKSSTKKMILMHFGSWFYENIVESKKKLIGLGLEKEMEIIPAHDGLEIKL